MTRIPLRCPCGSGLLATECCDDPERIGSRRAALASALLAEQQRPEQHLHLVGSMVFKGQRVRALHSRIIFRPAEESFHDFLLCVVKWTFGEAWWKQARGTKAHVVFDWFDAWEAVTFREPESVVVTPYGTRYMATASGPAKALLNFGYDLFCLQAIDRLPEHLVDRLRKSDRFQAARYEIAIAAIMARAGFSIRFTDDTHVAAKHCEFIATHKPSGVEVCVEGKSRVRPGSLRQKGKFRYQQDSKGLSRLIREASRQGIPGKPLVIFIEANVPATPDVAPPEKPWVRDLSAAADDLESRAGEAGVPYSLVIGTNFGHHYGPMDSAARCEWGFVTPPVSTVPLARDIVQDIARSALAWSRIPDEV